MKNMNKLIVAGGSGFMGQHLIESLRNRFKEVVVLTRHKSRSEDNMRWVQWDGKNHGNWANELENADLLINLCGKSVDCRHNAKNREEIITSRVNSTLALGAAAICCVNPPSTWVNAASATIYRHEEKWPMDEKQGIIGEGFSVEVCQKWESTFAQIPVPGTRKITLRTALVLGKAGGVLNRLKTIAQLGLGGYQGSGNQKMSWVHEDDFVNMVLFCHQNEHIEGVINCCAPHPLNNRRFMSKLRKELHVPMGLPLPKPLINLGALLIGTEPELVLKSRYVMPRRMMEAGYPFQFPHLNQALQHLLR